MGKIPCPLPFPSKQNSTNSDEFHQIYSDSSLSSSRSSSSLYSQPSLPSIPSLTPLSTHSELLSNTFCASTFTGLSSSVFCLSLAGKHLYTGTSNGEVLLRNQEKNLSIVVAQKQSKSSVKSIVIFGDKLFTAHQDHKIRVWKIDDHDHNQNNYKRIATLPTLNDRCMRLFSAKNYVEVRRHKKCTWVHHVDTVSALAISSDNTLLYSASWDRTFKIWRISDFKCLESVWNAHDDAINAIALSKNGYVYTGSADMKIKIWKKEQGEKNVHTLISTLEKHKSSVNALALSTDGSILYSGACDRSIIVWEKDSGGDKMVVSGALRGHTKAILCLSVVDDLVCSGSADKTVRIWMKGIGKSYSCLAVLEGHNGPVKCLTASSDNSNSNSDDFGCGNSYVVYSGSLDCDIKVWKIWVP
ncbi:protein JINGUBANG-like [Solanum pennellii]|uniref:Protein JINGUBANG-like n=1 Tax=Solanum pennellii TaxID=28526 RepID=A0ABM1GRB9_SOLPN|nr:protein JINGUBANG-like [Solanum pennellii]